MKSLNEIMGSREKVAKTVFEKWGKVTGFIDVNDPRPFGSGVDDDLIYNDILGYVKVKEVREAQRNGIICLQKGKWRITTKPVVVSSENKERFYAKRYIGETVYVPSDEWLAYEEKKHPKHPLEIDEP